MTIAPGLPPLEGLHSQGARQPPIRTPDFFDPFFGREAPGLAGRGLCPSDSLPTPNPAATRVRGRSFPFTVFKEIPRTSVHRHRQHHRQWPDHLSPDYAPSSTTPATQTERSATNRLRPTFVPVRLAFTWLGVRKTLAPEQWTAAARPFQAELGTLLGHESDPRHEAPELQERRPGP